MKIFIVSIIILAILFVAFKSLYKAFIKGESQCNCSKDKKAKCNFKNICKH